MKNLPAIVLAILFVRSLVQAESTPASRDVTINDYLRLENVGRALPDPAGKRFVYERMPPYRDNPDFGIPSAFTEIVGDRLMTVDAQDPKSAQPLFPPARDTGYWLANFSPSGTHLAFYQVRRGEVSLGVYDFTTGRVVTFDAAPDYRTEDGSPPLWVDEDVLIYAATAAGDQPWRISIRRQTPVKLAAAWEKTWAGKEPSYLTATSGLNEELAALPGRLVLADMRTGRTRELGTGSMRTPALSPDGRYVAALRQYELPQPDPNTPSLDTLWTRSELWVFDLKTGQARAAAPGKDEFRGVMAWSPDSTRLAFFAWDRGAKVQSGVFHVLDVRSGRIEVMPHTGVDLVSQRERSGRQRPEPPLWLGKKFAVFARPQASADAAPRFTYRDAKNAPPEKPHWYLLSAAQPPKNLTFGLKDIAGAPLAHDKRQFFLIADGDIWRISADGKRANITRGKWGTLSSAQEGASSSTRILVTGKLNEISRTLLVDLMSRDVVPLISNLSEEASLYAMGPPANKAALFREYDEAGSRVTVRTALGQPVIVDRLNTHLHGIRRGRQQAITYDYKAKNGETHSLRSCLYLPAGYQAGTRYPLIVEVYPGSRPRCGGSAHAYYDQPLEQGVINSMGIPADLLASDGYMYLWAASPMDLQREGSAPLANIAPLALAAADAAVAQGYADGERLGLFGGSQGGITSLWVVTQTNRFRAVVSLNGWVDPLRHYFAAEGIYQYFNSSEFRFTGNALRYEFDGEALGLGARPWENVDAFLTNSPLMHAKDIQTPTLLITSDMDGSSMEQYEAMFAALYRLGKPAKLLSYWGEGHGNSSPANIRHVWESMFDWFDTYVKGAGHDNRETQQPLSN